MEKLSWAVRISKSPQMLLPFPAETCWPPNTRRMAPVAPKTIPVIFLPVTGSFRKKAERIRVRIGRLVVMMEASMAMSG